MPTGGFALSAETRRLVLSTLDGKERGPDRNSLEPFNHRQSEIKVTRERRMRHETGNFDPRDCDRGRLGA